MRELRALLAAALLGGCAHDGRKLEGRYALDAPGDGWRVVDPGGADYAWFNTDLSATIYGDSNCGKHFEDGTLTAVSDHLTAGIARGTPLQEERLTLDGREALLRVRDGAVDGVAVRVGSVVLNKDSCTYDLVYLAPPANFEAGWDRFRALAGSLRTLGGTAEE